MSSFPPQAYCIEESCRKVIDARFPYCPYCGHDNRPPDQQTPHGICGTHRLVRGGRFCYRCGESIDDPGPWNRHQRRTAGMFLLAAGLLLGAFGLYVHLCRTGSPLPGQDWVLSWVDRPVRSRSGRETAGTTAVSVSLVLGALSVTFGFGLLLQRYVRR